MMNATTMQLTNGMIATARTRAQVVGISSPEYHEATPTDILAVVIFFLVCILIVAAIAFGIVMLYKHVKGKGKGASAAVGRSAFMPRPSQVAATPTRSCASCEATIPQASKFCPKCGAGQE